MDSKYCFVERSVGLNLKFSTTAWAHELSLEVRCPWKCSQSGLSFSTCRDSFERIRNSDMFETVKIMPCHADCKLYMACHSYLQQSFLILPPFSLLPLDVLPVEDLLRRVTSKEFFRSKSEGTAVSSAVHLLQQYLTTKVLVNRLI